MATRYLDPRNGNDANDGTSLALAKLTIAGINALAGNGDIINIAPGMLKTGTDSAPAKATSLTSTITWQAIDRHTVTWIKDTAGVFVTFGSANDSIKFKGIVFKDLPSHFIDVTVTTSKTFMTLEHCVFENIGGFIQRNLSVTTESPVDVTYCVFDDCGDTTGALFHDVVADDAVTVNRINNCLFYNCNTGSNPLIEISGSGTDNDDYFNNIFLNNTAGKIWDVNVGDGSSYLESWDFNTYFGNTLSVGFATTVTGTHATFAAWQSATAADDNGLTTDPQLLDVIKGLYGAIAFGNSDRTGQGNATRGPQGVMFGFSDNLDAATHWDNATISPVGEATQVSGNWEHTGNEATVVTVTLPARDLGAIYRITGFRQIADEDFPEGVADFDITASTRRSLEYRAATVPLTSEPFVEYDEGDVLTINARYVQSRVTLRNDG